MVTRLEPSQERSRQRRDALLAAAIDLLAEGGARAVTHRAVAARAGLSAGTTTYYFESIQHLTNEALAKHVSDRVAELEELAAVASSGGDNAEEVAIRFAEALADRDPDVIVAQFEIYLEAWRNPALREPVADAINAFERLATSALEWLGARDPKVAAEAMVALINGFALNRLARPRSRDEEVESLRTAMRALFLSQVMSEEEIDELRNRFLRPLGPPVEVSSAGG